MTLGTRFTAPEGLGVLRKRGDYSLLRVDPQAKRVLLVDWLVDASVSGSKKVPKQTAKLVILDISTFERGLCSGQLIRSETQSLLPPWHADFGVTDFERIEASRGGASRNRNLVDERLMNLAPLLADEVRLLSDPLPERAINRAIRAMTPKQNETRIRIQFLTYLSCGRNIWSLYPTFHRCGHWDRQDQKYQHSKFGAPSTIQGRHKGYWLSAENIARCIRAYEKYKGRGVKLWDIWILALKNEFGCVVTGSKSTPTIVHPAGDAHPSYEQFRYRIHNKFEINNVHQTLYGAARIRQRAKVSKGPFSESLSLIFEKVEADAFFVKELPKSFDSNNPLPPLVVVRLRCVTTGIIAGIGIGFVSETAEIYRAALFCAAVPKAYFCSLFGLDITDEEWPCVGLTQSWTTDRGPGAALRMMSTEDSSFGMVEMTPSHEGQSKGGIESSNPRNPKQIGAPGYFQSDLNPVMLARRIINSTVAFNMRSDASSRLTDEMIESEVCANPLGIFNFLNGIYRTAAVPMPRDEAIRTFLKRVKFKVMQDGVYFEGRRFDSDDLRNTRLLEKLYSKQLTEVEGYILLMCTRVAWIDFGGSIIDVNAKMRLQDDPEQLLKSKLELELLAQKKRDLINEQRNRKAAIALNEQSRFEEQTGQKYNPPAYRRGRANKGTADQKRESSELLKALVAGK